MTEEVPYFENALRAAQERLTRILGEECVVRIHVELDDGLINVVEGIDHEKFRQELWYDPEEIRRRSDERGFVLFLVVCGGRPVAFLYGYEDAERSGFFLDEVATLVEGRGVGTILVSLLLMYCYDVGYGSVRLYTEEDDERGRHLRRFYENIGFQRIGSTPEEGVEMRLKLEAAMLREVYTKYIEPESARSYTPPFPPS